MKKAGKTPEQVLRRANIVFYGGLVLMLLCLMMVNGGVGPVWTGWMVLSVVGFLACLGAFVYAGAYFRCPHCGASLMRGGRMPVRVPAYCSDCGGKIEESE